MAQHVFGHTDEVLQAPMQPADWQRLSHGMPVRFRDGVAGTIEHLGLDPEHAGIGEVMVRLAVPPFEAIMVPLERVHSIDELGVIVDMVSTPVELLPDHFTS